MKTIWLKHGGTQKPRAKFQFFQGKLQKNAKILVAIAAQTPPLQYAATDCSYVTIFPKFLGKRFHQ